MDLHKIGSKVLAVVATVGLAALFACGGEAKVNVDCEGESEGVRCKLQHTQGSAAVETCWDVIFQCQNGTKPQGHACKSVAPGQTEQQMIPKEQVKGWNECDKAVSASVTNLTLAAK